MMIGKRSQSGRIHKCKSQSLGRGGAPHIVEKLEQLYTILLDLPNSEIVSSCCKQIRVDAILIWYEHDLGSGIRVCKRLGTGPIQTLLFHHPLHTSMHRLVEISDRAYGQSG